MQSAATALLWSNPVRIALIAYFHPDVLGFHAFRLFERMIEFSRSGLFVRRAFRLGGSVFRRRVFCAKAIPAGAAARKTAIAAATNFFRNIPIKITSFTAGGEDPSAL